MLDFYYLILFSLPIDKKIYVEEKFVYGIMLSFTTLVLSTILACIVEVINDGTLTNENVVTALAYFPIILLLISFMIPLQLKYGGEKARIAMIGVFAVLALLGYGIYKVVSIMNVNMMPLLQSLTTMNIYVLIGLCLFVSIVLCFVSMKISISVMKKKEF